MKDRIKNLIAISILSGGVLLISNLAATKIWSFCGIPFDGGLLLFPLSYVLGDLAIELFGRKVARSIIWSSFVLNMIAAIILIVVGMLPPYSEWNNQSAYEAILGFAPRVVVGSLIAYVVSSLVNNMIFQKIKDSTLVERRDKSFFSRAVGSSAIAKLIDIIVFETIAFLYVLPLKDFLIQMAFAYLAGMILEIALFPITNLLAHVLRQEQQ